MRCIKFHKKVKQTIKARAGRPVSRPRILTIGIHTPRFLERLLLCIPFIENLSFGIKDRDISENDDAHDRIT
jgi:hypothetical protein